MQELPQEFLDRMKVRLGLDFPAFLHAYERPPQKGLRVNTLKISPEKFEQISSFQLGKPVPWAKDCFYIGEEKAGGDLLHFAGLFYLQEPSAMCAAPLLNVAEGERVLDLCAAPGGKTTQLAAKMHGNGILIANEIDGRRAEILSQNTERMGISNCAILSVLPEKLAETFPAYFDKILVDAPCSGEGMFKKEPNAIPEWSVNNVRRCSLRQREILESASKMLAGGGRLVYSTCTFAEEEDEEQIENFLKNHKEFELLQMKKLLPHEVEGEGHFAAELYRKDIDIRGDAIDKREYFRKKGREFNFRRDTAAEKAFNEFSKEVLEDVPEGRITVLPDGRMYLLPEGTPDFGGLRILRLGTKLGEWDGKQFKPAHALVMSAQIRVRARIEFEEKEAKKFLRGETLDAPQGGDGIWTAVCFKGYPLGWGKPVGGVLKNHLPKGLRMYCNTRNGI